MVDYQSSKIYKITNDVNDEVYVGSTTQTLTKRFSWHITSSKNKDKNHLPLYVLMNELGTEHFCISLIEDYSCTNKTELRLREGHWIREQGTLNKNIAGRDIKQRYADNKEKKQDYNKQYNAENKENILEKKKQYYDENKEKILEKKKQYYDENKEKVKQMKSEKIQCECGAFSRRGEIARHCKSKKHITFIEQQNTAALNNLTLD